MNDRRAASGTASRRRLSWVIFYGVSTLALGACFFAVLETGIPTSAGLALLGGLIVVGIAAALMDPIVSALLEPGERRQVPYGSQDIGGGFDGGGYGGGDYGGGDCGGGGGGGGGDC
jgi:hypothetical protein